jgi:hypothetical protein
MVRKRRSKIRYLIDVMPLTVMVSGMAGSAVQNATPNRVQRRVVRWVVQPGDVFITGITNDEGYALFGTGRCCLGQQAKQQHTTKEEFSNGGVSKSKAMSSLILSPESQISSFEAASGATISVSPGSAFAPARKPAAPSSHCWCSSRIGGHRP